MDRDAPECRLTVEELAEIARIAEQAANITWGEAKFPLDFVYQRPAPGLAAESDAAKVARWRREFPSNTPHDWLAAAAREIRNYGRAPSPEKAVRVLRNVRIMAEAGLEPRP